MKTLRFLLINLFIRDHRKTLDIINGLDNVPSKPKKKQKIYGDMSAWLTISEDEEVRNSKPTVISKPKNKRDELLEGLKYLKSKPNKTVKDKESIYTLEMLLKNIKS